MISFSQFRHIAEDVSLGDIESQIDALFDELKTKLKGFTDNRPQSWVDNAKAFSAMWRNKYGARHGLVPTAATPTNLEHYKSLTECVDKLWESVAPLAGGSELEAVIDQYRDRFKGIVKSYIQTLTPQTQTLTPQIEPQKRTRRPRAVVASPETPPTQEPSAQVPQSQPEATPQPTQEPAASTSEPGKGLSSEEAEQMKMGAMIAYCRDVLGISETPIPQDELNIVKDEFKDFDPSKHLQHKDYYISLAREYSASPAPVKHATSNIETLPGEEPLSGSPNKEQLMTMKPLDFKKHIEENDPELASAYEGQNWWARTMRQDLVDAYLASKTKTESLQHYVEKYKSMLQTPTRPFLLGEARNLPTSERVEYLKKSLRRD